MCGLPKGNFTEKLCLSHLNVLELSSLVLIVHALLQLSPE